MSTLQWRELDEEDRPQLGTQHAHPLPGCLMDGTGIGGAGQEKGKTTRARRSWTKPEEDALIHYLLDIVAEGWKADNGFKAGFQRELEKGMKKLLPDSVH
ncbi:hypothetical protein ACS0TY_008472 [Phlomoides rotata]